MRLVAIGRNGAPTEHTPELPKMARAIIAETRSMYGAADYVEPWVGYLAVEENAIIGFCAFKSAPKDGAVEIAYATMPEREGRGIATRMVRRLIEMAHAADSSLAIRAQTLREENASTAILKKLGFVLQGTVMHPEDGKVWEWRRPPAA